MSDETTSSNQNAAPVVQGVVMDWKPRYMVRSDRDSVANREPEQMEWRTADQKYEESIEALIASTPHLREILNSGKHIVVNRMMGYLTENVKYLGSP